MDTVWVLGDQLDATAPALAGREPGSCRVLLVESAAKIEGRPWHRQRLHLVLTAMRRFAAELIDAGHDVDLRRAPTMTAGFGDHCAEHRPGRVLATEPRSWAATALLQDLDVELVADDHFLCHRHEFAEWADGRRRLTMEDFYRWQRRRTGYLMDGDEPAGGRWNLDAENREPPPTDGRAWPSVVPFELDDLDRTVLSEIDELPAPVGAPPAGWWPTSRAQARQRLDEFVDGGGLAAFGPHEDAMLAAEWKLAHSTLSSSLNLGLLRPDEVCDAVEAAYRAGDAPLASAEGFIRQVIGWREFVWGVYWLEMPDYRHVDELGADAPLPPLYTGGSTDMACVSTALADVDARAWTHHIPRLMVLGNLSLLAGVRPGELSDWMWERFVDGAEWVMLPNVMGMALHADGGRMATKPYAAGGAYIDRMSDHCSGCRFDPRSRTGDDACPFTSLYWDFLTHHRERFAANHRMGHQLAGIDRLKDLDETRARAAEVLDLLADGRL